MIEVAHPPQTHALTLSKDNTTDEVEQSYATM